MILVASAFIAACVKQDFDRPPITTIPVGDVYTIGDLVNILNTTGATQFNNNASVYGIVTMDEVSGNIYKSAYIQDATGAINLRLQESGGLRVGDSIRVYLKGVILSEYNKLRQLSNVHNDSNIVILANRKFIEPEVVTIDQIKTGSYQCKLIKLENVQFIAGDTASTWADTDVTTNRTIEDCSGKSVIVRTSNFASFQGENLPNGKGSLVAIAGIFNTTPQLYVRSTTEVKMDSARCGSGGGGGGEAVDMVNENFSTAQDNSDINIPGWANIAEAGTRKWQGKIYQGDGYAQATGYNSNLPSMITWLVTPNVKMDQKKYLRFRTAKAYWEHGDDVPLTVMVSSNFDGVNVATASWTPIEAKVVGRADADNTWVPSGDIDLSAFIPDGKIAVAFKYTGSGTKSTSIRIDDVYIGTQAGGGGGGGETGGTFENPFTVEEAISKQNATPYVNGWVQGYIVGSVKNGVTAVTSNDDIHWSAPFALATNVLIASTPGVTDYTQCVFVNMPAGSDFRTQVNLLDNPTNLGKKLKAVGNLRTYFGAAGLRDNPGTSADFLLEGGGGGTVGGTFENPFTVEEAISKQNATPYVNGWVKGYIVGSVKSGITSVTSNADIHWSAPFTLATNVLIASTPGVTDYTQCVFVNMPAGSAFRAQVNLMDNPANLGKKLKAVGNLRSYFGAAGLRDNPGTSADFVLEGGGGGGGGTALFSETFSSNLGTFSQYSVEGNQVWGWGNFDGGCAVMTGYVNPDRFPNDDWLISPAINLSAHTGAVLTIRQAANFVSSEWSFLQVLVSTDYSGSGNPATQGTWTEINVPNKPSGTDWAFVDSGDIDFSAYDGKPAVYVAFRYRSSSTIASTWEISKVEVK